MEGTGGGKALLRWDISTWEKIGLYDSAASKFEKAALSPEMALRLEKAFQLNMDMLLSMQAWFDATEMRKQEGKIKISPYVPA